MQAPIEFDLCQSLPWRSFLTGRWQSLVYLSYMLVTTLMAACQANERGISPRPGRNQLILDLPIGIPLAYQENLRVAALWRALIVALAQH